MPQPLCRLLAFSKSNCNGCLTLISAARTALAHVTFIIAVSHRLTWHYWCRGDLQGIPDGSVHIEVQTLPAWLWERGCEGQWQTVHWHWRGRFYLLSDQQHQRELWKHCTGEKLKLERAPGRGSNCQGVCTLIVLKANFMMVQLEISSMESSKRYVKMEDIRRTII